MIERQLESAVSPEAALERLREGNDRFASGRSRHPHADAGRLAETLRTGQRPMAAILSCCDSRVPVEIIFDQGVGDLFVVRVAGNICQTDEIASLEMAVGMFAAPVVVVMGHGDCGTVAAAMGGAEVAISIRPVVDKVMPVVAKVRQSRPDLNGEALAWEVVRANVWQSVEQLIRRSSAIRERLRAGRIAVVGALYDLATGRVEWLGPHPDQRAL